MRLEFGSNKSQEGFDCYEDLSNNKFLYIFPILLIYLLSELHTSLMLQIQPRSNMHMDYQREQSDFCPNEIETEFCCFVRCCDMEPAER